MKMHSLTPPGHGDTRTSAVLFKLAAQLNPEVGHKIFTVISAGD